MDIKKELNGNKTLIVKIPSQKYNKSIIQFAKKLAEKNTVCYITLSKTFDSLYDSFVKNKVKVENIIFIDSISKSIRDVDESTDKCFYTSSPEALTEISLIISKLLKHEFNYLIFDSIDNLLIYRKNKEVEQFIIDVSNKIKRSKTKGVFYALDIETHSSIIKSISMFVDKVKKVN